MRIDAAVEARGAFRGDTGQSVFDIPVEEREVARYHPDIVAASRRFDLTPVYMTAVHQTTEGSVYLWVTEGSEGCYVSRIQGCEIDSGYIVESVAEGFRHNKIRFAALFPEHRCSGECQRHE